MHVAMKLESRINLGLQAKMKMRVFAVFLAGLFLLGACFQSGVQTPVGVHCPTAPVQSVLVPVHDKCGCVIGYRSEAPKPGDKAFVQCRCAEKKSTERAVSPPPKVVLFVLDQEQVASPGQLVIPQTVPPYLASISTCENLPPLPPPIAA